LPCYAKKFVTHRVANQQAERLVLKRSFITHRVMKRRPVS